MHNSSRQLPSELPADLLSARLVWVQAVQLLPSRSRSQTCWYLHHHSRRSREFARKPFFSNPAGSFFPALGQQPLRILRKSSMCNASGHCLEDLPLTSSALLPRPVLGGEPCGGCLRPWFMARCSTATVLCTPALLYTVYCSVPVYKLLCMQQ
jgi:hypothetical protein